MTLNANGNVGIGTKSPSSKLHLSSLGGVTLNIEADTNNVGEDQNASIFLSQDGGLVTGRIGYRSGLNRLEFINEEDDSLILGTDNQDRLTILSNGNVGIATSTPQTKLDVNGDFDVAPSGGNVTGGHALIGSPGTFNLLFDGNELQARVGIAPSTLFLNDWGGKRPDR